MIFGVAIATALMPPLCTAGYGLANGNLPYFGGAMNLFTINTIFIALATFIVLKVLRFPMLRYANSKRRKRVAQLASLAALVVMAYPTYTFIQVWKASGYENDYNAFVKNEIDGNTELWLQRGIPDYEGKTITLYFNGEIAEATEVDLRNELKGYENIADFDLKVNGNKNRSFDKISEAYDRAISDLDKKDNIIEGLQIEIENLKGTISQMDEKQNSFSFSNLSKDAKIQFQDLQYFGFAKMPTSTNFRSVDTTNVALVRWSESITDSLATIKNKALSQWLKSQTKADTVFVKSE